jgi:hypothetical protein
MWKPIAWPPPLLASALAGIASLTVHRSSRRPGRKHGWHPLTVRSMLRWPQMATLEDRNLNECPTFTDSTNSK